MKFFNSLKVRFVSLFIIFVVVLIAVLVVMSVAQMSTAVTDAFANQGMQIVEKAASVIDGDSFEALVKSMDVRDPFYEETRQTLLQLKKLSGCVYLYTMAPKRGAVWQYIIDGSAEPDDKDNFSELGNEEDTSEFDHAFAEVLISGKTEISGLVDQGEWGWLISVYTPIRNSSGKIIGVAACDFDGTDLHDSINSIRIRQTATGGVFVIIGIMLLLFFMRMIFTPIKEINIIFKDIAHGDGDLTKRVTRVADNEIGELAQSFNVTLDKITSVIITVVKETKALFKTGNELSERMIKTSAAVNQITAGIHSIKTRIINQSTSINETNSTMEQVVTNINQLNEHVENQSTHIAQASSAIEEVVANTSSVNNTLIKNSSNVKALLSASEAGHNGLQEVALDIKEIAQESEGLLEINSVMENISSQTNLLSMNAAIEAAHAGEAGKGFAVVAGEIRKLAESSSTQSKTIGVVLKKIKDSISKITARAENVMEKFNAIDENVKTVSQQEEIIRNAMEEQQAGSKQLLAGISGVNDITKQVRDGSNKMLAGSKEVIRESETLERVTLDITNGMNEMDAGAEQITAAIKRVSEICTLNHENIEALAKDVSRFKVKI